jgi:hypothetical protein
MTDETHAASADEWWFQRRWSDFRRGSTAVALCFPGGRVEGVLYDEGVPRTANAILAALPLSLPLVHVAWSGEMCMATETYGEIGPSEPENHVRLVRPGDLTWDAKYGELGVVYGTAECRLPSGPNTVVVFGSIQTGLDELARFGRARRFEGIATARLERV